MTTDIGFIDSPSMRRLFKFLDATKISIPVVALLKKIIEKKLGDGFKFGRLQMLACGQSHLDAAWRWRKKQSILKARATFSKAIKHMDEYERFSFAQPSPAYYLWMEQYFPDLYQKIKDKTETGQWILIGGMWVEPDLNVPSGEALVRQRLYGMRFFHDEFGHMPDVEFLQDVFGFCWSLPQILAKSGCKMFVTGKIFWNDTNKFPLGMFHWQGPDGTTIPSLLLHFGYFLPRTYGKEYPDIYRLMKDRVVPGETPVYDYSTPVQLIRAQQSDELMESNIFGYGLGDGGHGPIELEMTVVKAFKIMFPKKFKFMRRGDFTRLFKKYLDRWATWRDELYLEIHRGTYTTNSKAKWYNRKLEALAENAEKACALAAMTGLAPYPAKNLLKAWRLLLFQQFHDILPGSSIPEVYFDSYKESEVAWKLFEDCLAGAFSAITARNGTRLGLLNGVSTSRQDLVKVDKAALDAASLDWRALKEGSFQETTSGGHAMVFLKVKMDPVAIISGSLKELQEGGAIVPASSGLLKINTINGNVVLENEFFTVVVDGTTGWVTRLHSKKLGFEAIDGPANKIMLFQDEPNRSDAWNIDPDYMDHPIEISEKATKIEIIERGPLRVGVEVIHEHDASRFIQRIYLQDGDDVVRCSMDVDWHQTATIFKLSFPTAIKTDKVAAEIPYAYINRPVHPVQPMEKARWEYSGQRWMDLSDGSHGVSLLNDCKYGFNVVGNDLRLTVMRGPRYVGYAPETIFVDREDTSLPTHVDQHFHEDIKYGIHVHAGDWRHGTWARALEFNSEIIARIVGSKDEETRGPRITGGITCSAKNIAMTALKVHEDEERLDIPSKFVARFVEMEGKKTTARVVFPGSLDIKEARVVDLLEMSEIEPAGVEVDGPVMSFTISPHEIKTVEFTIENEHAMGP